MKTKLFLFMLIIMICTNIGIAFSDPGPQIVVGVESNEIVTDNSVNTWGSSAPQNAGNLPIGHYAPGLYVAGDPMGAENAPGYHPLNQLLGIKKSYTAEQFSNVWKNVRAKRYSINNLNAFDVPNIPPQRRIRIIDRVPAGHIFILAGQVSISDKVVFKSPIERLSFIGLHAMDFGANTLLFGWEGVGNGMKYAKFDIGSSGGYMTGVADIARLVNGFVSGGTGSSEQTKPPWLGLFAGRLYPVEQIREAWFYWNNLYQKAGYDPEFLEIDFDRITAAHDLSDNPFFSNDIDTKLIRDYVFGKLTEIENIGKMPKELEPPKKADAKAIAPAKTGEKVTLKDNLTGEVIEDVSFAELFLLFDFNKYDIRQDQRDNAQKAVTFGMNFAREYAKAGKPKKVRIVSAGYADHIGSNEYNLILTQKRAYTLQAHIVEGMKNAKDEQGRRFMTDKEISDVITVFAGSNVNPLTDHPIDNADKERAAVVWVKGIRLYNPERS